MSRQLESARDIFLQAVELSQHEWDSYLDEKCSDDDDLKRRVRDLLSAHQGNDSFLDQQPATTPLVITESPGDTISSYKLLQQIGEGGFGVVFMAEQTKPIRRKVALKVIKPGMDTKEVVARFEAERQALAVMDHPNIAKVFDAGATDRGRPYFVMELVRGVPLTQYADANHLSTAERLDLFVQICRAVHHAHQKGIIHRDLKPSNVLVTLHDGLPVPKIIDFGVAKAINQPLTEKTMFTQFGQTIGTPQYMSPEQAELSGLDIDTRSDVYSLGVILYELLTGQTPFTVEQIRKAGLDEMRRVIREQEPVRPSSILETFDADTATVVASHRSSKPEQLRKSIRGDLDWIVLMALEKDRQRRYDTASSFAEDIENHIHHRPVNASPPTLGYQCWKFYRRYESACKVALTISALLVAAIAATTGLWIKAVQSEQETMTAMIELDQRSIELDEQRQVAEKAAERSQTTLTLLIDMLSKAGTNPETGIEYTVSDALSSLASSSLLNVADFPLNVLAELHRELGKAYLRAGKGDRAIEHLQISCDQSNEFFGRQSLQLAECLRYLGEAKNSPEHFQKAIDIFDSLDARRESLFTRIALGKLFLVSGDLNSAKTTLHRACSDFDQLNPRVDLIDIPHLLLSRVYQGLKLKSEEETYFDSAMSIAVRQYGDSSNDWRDLANSHYDHQRYWESEFAYLVFMRFGNQNGDYKLANSYYQNGALVRAIDYMRQSYDRFAEQGEASSARSRANALGFFYKEHGDVANAAKWFADAVKWAIRMRNGDGNMALAQLLLLAESSPEAKRVARKLADELLKMSAENLTQANSLADALGFLQLCGYEVECDDVWMPRRATSHIKDLARNGHFDAAFDFGKRSCSKLATYDQEHHSWQQMRCARLLYQCLDFTKATEFQNYAVDASQREQGDNRRQTAWANFELAHILYFGGESKKAMSLASDTLAEIQKLNAENSYIAHEVGDTFCQWQLRVIANGESGARIVLEEAANVDTSGFEDNGIRLFNLAHGMAHEELGNHRDAIDAYETAVGLKYERPGYPQFHFDDRLLELLDTTDQLDRGKHIFTDALETRREDLPDRHPMIGLTRLRLADVLVRSGEDAELAIELLDQARETMQLHKMTPQHVFDRIDRLTEQAKSL